MVSSHISPTRSLPAFLLLFSYALLRAAAPCSASRPPKPSFLLKHAAHDLVVTGRASSCSGSTRYEACGQGTKCCKLPTRCCSKGCCESDVKCKASSSRTASSYRALQTSVSTSTISGPGTKRGSNPATAAASAPPQHLLLRRFDALVRTAVALLAPARRVFAAATAATGTRTRVTAAATPQRVLLPGSTTVRQFECQGQTKYESCSLTRCCVLPKCCCSGGDGCCDREAKCFPAAATATLRSGRRVALADLQVGDEVAVGAARFSPIIAFSHADPAARATFVRFALRRPDGAATDGARVWTISATPGHLMLVARAAATKNGDKKISRVPTAARDVRVGDRLPMVVPGAGGAASPQQEIDVPVIKVDYVESTGLFNPHTRDGAIVVDGVICSTYTQHVPFVAAHGLLLPIRAAYNAIAAAISTRASV